MISITLEHKARVITMVDRDLDWLLKSSESDINKGSIPLTPNEAKLSSLTMSNPLGNNKIQLPYYAEKATYSLLSGLKNQVNLVPGTIIVTDLLFVAEHTGVYVGDGSVVELYGDGSINLISIKDFLNGGYKNNDISPRTGINIYAATYSGKCIASKRVAERALNLKNKFTGKKIDYHLFKNNCHMFSGYCFFGEGFQKNTDCALFKGLTKKIIDSTIPRTDKKASFWRELFKYEEDSPYSRNDLNKFSWMQVSATN